MAFYKEARSARDFDAGIGSALTAVLMNPAFLFRVERIRNRRRRAAPIASPIVALASRLSFFLWSSIPDDELLDAAIRGELSRPDVLERQVRRMLADPRSNNLASNFAGQWLLLRNLESVEPGPASVSRLRRQPASGVPAGDRALLRQRVREDRSVLDLINADYTFLNERLRSTTEFPVYGSRFRRVGSAGGQQPRRIAAPRQHPGRHVLRDADFACHPRQVGADNLSVLRRRRRRRMCRCLRKL